MIKDMLEDIIEVVSKNVNAVPVPEDEYTHMKYPKIISLMNFHVMRYKLEGFGHLMIMHTTTKMGMELVTASFMPAECVNLPYLLVDAMEMKKKRCVFVEYYGCGNEDLNDAALKKVYEKYKSLEEYDEKYNWYVAERMPYSLIKTGDKQELAKMAIDSISAYISSVKDAGKDPSYKDKLGDFRTRMIVEGNPSSKTLKMLLGEEGAQKFTENVIMPL